MTRPPGPSSPVRPLLLTALVWPGLGQLSEGRRLRGAAFAGTALAAAGAFVWTLFREMLVRIPQDGALLDPAEVWDLAHQIVGSAGDVLQLWIVVLIAAWGAAVLDSAVSYHRRR